MNGHNSAYLMAMKGLIEAAKRLYKAGDDTGFSEAVSTAVESLGVASKQLHQEVAEVITGAEQIISEASTEND